MINKHFIVPEKTVSIQETKKRLDLLPKIAAIFDESTEIIYVGGSLATGQNYSVHPDSDIDTALFVSQQTIEKIVKTKMFEPEKLQYFVNGYKKGHAKQFSLDTYIDGVRVECHFVDRVAYLEGLDKHHESIMRFRTSDTTPTINYGFSFAGEEIETVLPTQKRDEWFISPFPFYIRTRNLFFPGRLLTNLLGTPVILKGKEILEPHINNLWGWVAEEFQSFKNTYPDTDCSIIKSMPGNWKFSSETKESLEKHIENELKNLK